MPRSCAGSAYADPDERIEVLAGLPGVIRFSPSDAELNAQVTGVLLRGIPRAENAAIVGLRYLAGAKEPVIDIRQVKNRQGLPDTFRTSRRLVRDALEQRRQSVMYVWQKGEMSQDYTQLVGCDWAICIPLSEEKQDGDPGPSGAAGLPATTPAAPLPTAPLGAVPGTSSVPHEQLGIYLSGTLPTAQVGTPLRDDVLRSDLKFTELVADIFGALRRMSGLQRQLGQFRNFLPQAVVNVMGTKPAPQVEELLRPCVAEITVLFCDIRGSCRIAELGQDNLLRLWDHVSAVLGIMSSSIRDEGGVIADLQGDAIMAFWGWPLRDGQSLEHAHRAALTICQRLARETATGPLGVVRCGIGIAHGNAVVGRLGTPDQFKIDAFGPTVNLAARLESLAKFFGVRIVVDKNCQEFLSHHASALGGCLRRLGQVRLAGMSRVEEVAELAPAGTTWSGAHTPKAEAALAGVTGVGIHADVQGLTPLGHPGDAFVLSPDTARRYETALHTFEEGRWAEARPILEGLGEDGPARRLLEFLAQHPQGPPPGWKGVLTQEVK